MYTNWVSINLLIAPQLIIERLLYCFLAVVPIISKTIYFRPFIFTKLSIK